MKNQAYIRKNFQLTQSQAALLSALSSASGLTEAELVRRAIDAYLRAPALTIQNATTGTTKSAA